MIPVKSLSAEYNTVKGRFLQNPGEQFARISPGPRPRGDYFYILFSTSFSLPPSF